MMCCTEKNRQNYFFGSPTQDVFRTTDVGQWQKNVFGEETHPCFQLGFLTTSCTVVMLLCWQNPKAIPAALTTWLTWNKCRPTDVKWSANGSQIPAPSLGRHPSSKSSFILISTAHLRPGTIPVLSRAANKQNVLMTVSLHWFQGWRIWGLWGLTNNLQKKVPWPIIWWVNGRVKCWSNKPDKGRMILGCSCLCVIASSQFVTKWCCSLNYSPVRWGSKAN